MAMPKHGFCAICDKDYKTATALSKHMNNTHSGAYQCSECDAGFRKRDQLELHLSRQHRVFLADLDVNSNKTKKNKVPLTPAFINANEDDSFVSLSDLETFTNEDQQVDVPAFVIEETVGESSKSVNLPPPSDKLQLTTDIQVADRQRLKESLAAANDKLEREVWARQHAEHLIEIYRGMVDNLGHTMKRQADRADMFFDQWLTEKKLRMEAEATVKDLRQQLKAAAKAQDPAAKPATPAKTAATTTKPAAK
jgi:hypothetical protein